MFSKTCEYGIKAALYIAEQSQLKRKVGLKEVAAAVESPLAYTSKILQILAKDGFISSEKGPTGGFFIEQSKLKVFALSDIVKAIDGDAIYMGCGLGLNQCNENKPCPLHNQFKSIRDNLRIMLENTTLQSLIGDVEKGLTFLKR